MKRKILIVTLIALLLAITLAACGGNDKADTDKPATQTSSQTKADDQSAAKSDEKAPEPTNTPEPAPTATPEPTAAPEPTATPESEDDEEELASDFANITDVVDSYRSEGEMLYDVSVTPANDEKETHLQMTFSTAWVKADNAAGYNSESIIEGLSLAGGGEDTEDIPDSMQVINIDDVTYINFGGDWMTMPRDAAGDDMAIDMGIDQFIAKKDELKRVGTEKINGIKAIHYQYKDSSAFNVMLNDILEDQLDESQSREQFEAKGTKTSGDIWIAKKGNYPVKVEIHMETTFKSKVDDTEIRITGITRNEITEVNSDVTIEAPDEAPKADDVNMPGFAPGEFPVPEKTTVASMFPGMSNMTSELSIDEVTAFFDTELTKLGWSREGDSNMAIWSKGDQSFTLMITPGETEGTTSVLVMTNQE